MNYTNYYFNETLTVTLDNWDVLTMTLPDISTVNDILWCRLRIKERPSLICVTSISIGDGIDEYVHYYRRFNNAYMTLPLTPNITEILELPFAENTSLSVSCLSEDNINTKLIDFTVYRIYKNKSKTIFVQGNYLHDMGRLIYLQKGTYNDNVIGCSLRNKESNETSKVELKLKYCEEWRPKADSDSLLRNVLITMCLPMICMMIVTGSYYWSHKGNKTAVNGTSRSDSNAYEEILLTCKESAVAVDAAPSPPRSGTPDSNIYEPIYDDVYEDRLRIVQFHIRLQKETNTSEPPPPPAAETIPLRELNHQALPTSPRCCKRLPSGSMIPASDLYLLNLDSEGYEIPDEQRFISHPLQASDEVV